MNRKERIAELESLAVNIKLNNKGVFERGPTKERVIAKKALAIIKDLEEENKKLKENMTVKQIAKAYDFEPRTKEQKRRSFELYQLNRKNNAK
jgi:hypothetical protein